MAQPTNAAAAAQGLDGAALAAFAALVSGKNQDGSTWSIPTSATISVAAEVTAGTPTTTNVASSASNVTLLTASATRLWAAVYNDSSAILYLKFGATASTSSYTVQLAAGGYYELPGTPIYTGIIDGIWASANGNARVTSLVA